MAKNRLEELVERYAGYVESGHEPTLAGMINLNSARNLAYSYRNSQKAIKEEFEAVLGLCVFILSNPTISKELFDPTIKLLSEAEKVLLRLENDKLTCDCLEMVKSAIEEIIDNLKNHKIQSKKKLSAIRRIAQITDSKIVKLKAKQDNEENVG